jgi:hypothetical protein
MKKLLFLSISSIFCFQIANAQIQTIADARNASLASNVTVRGVVTNGSELGIIRYLQDNTGGIAAYGGNLTSILRGDSVIFSGPLITFNNLLEISPATFTVISSNRPIPAPTVITPSQFGESNEGTLIRVVNCSFGNAAGGVFPSSATNYTCTCGGQPLAVRTNTFLSGTSIPSGTVNLTGVGSQFCVNPSSGCTTGYQLLLRTNSDISAAIVTGISENLNSTNVINLFPNPSSGYINFKLNKSLDYVSIRINNVLGETCYQTTEINDGLDVSNFSNGIYTFTAFTKDGIYQTKFVIAK